MFTRTLNGRFPPILFSLGIWLVLHSATIAGGDRPLTHSPYDPDAKVVDLIAGVNEGTIQAKVVTQGAKGGNLFLTNPGQETVTVNVPQAFVGIPIHAQFQGGNQPFGIGQSFGPAGNPGASPGMAQAGGTQAIGGSTQNAPGGVNNTAGTNGTANPFPQGFFSIPAQKTLRIPYRSVCLNYGLKEPISHTNIRLLAIEEYTEDPIVQDLINCVGSDRYEMKTVQAAIWHVANGVSWQGLAAKGNSPVKTPGDHYFSSRQIKSAMSIVESLYQEHHPGKAEKQTVSARE